MSIFIYLFSFDIYTRLELACMMLACELEKVTLPGWTIGNKVPPWAVVGSSHSLASKEGMDLGRCLVPGHGTFKQCPYFLSECSTQWCPLTVFVKISSLPPSLPSSFFLSLFVFQ